MSFKDDLDWYYGVGMCLFVRSPLNSILERQRIRAVDTTERDEEVRRMTWPYMHVAAEKNTAPGYEPDLTSLHRFGRISKIIYNLEKRNPLLESVLHAYFGDRGARWAATNDGRMVAVYPLTKTGRKWIDDMRAKADVPMHLIRDDERVANELEQQKASPTDIRQARIKRMEKEGLALLTEAFEVCKDICRENAI